jgi:hypothetical protein
MTMTNTNMTNMTNMTNIMKTDKQAARYTYSSAMAIYVFKDGTGWATLEDFKQGEAVERYQVNILGPSVGHDDTNFGPYKLAIISANPELSLLSAKATCEQFNRVFDISTNPEYPQDSCWECETGRNQGKPHQWNCAR